MARNSRWGYNVDDVSHARSHTGNDLDSHTGKRQWQTASGRGVGRNVVQLAYQQAGLHYFRKPDRFWFETYVNSVKRFRDIVTKAGADVMISNHTIYDESKMKLPLVPRANPVTIILT